MKTFWLCVATSLLTILVVRTLDNQAVSNVLHVYVIAERDENGRNGKMNAIEAYVKQSNGEGGYKLHFASARDVQASNRPLLTVLGGTSHIDAEAPLFVTLDLPTSSSKKALRAAIEDVDALKGEKRIQALRAVVPVFTVQPQPGAIDPCAQLADDVIYAKDNFGGVAFMFDKSGLEVLKKCVRPPS